MPMVQMLVGVGLVALLPAVSGIFGVRMALGATAGQVLRMVLAREIKLIVAAIAVGAIGTVAVTKTVFAELITIAAMHPWWPATLIVSCVVVAAFACGLATYRIVRIDPWTALRRT